MHRALARGTASVTLRVRPMRDTILESASLLLAVAFLEALLHTSRRTTRAVLREVPQGRRWFPVLAAIVLLAGAVRAWLAMRAAVSSDETFFDPYPDLASFVRGPEIAMNPPLYFVLSRPLAAWSGNDPLALRWTSVVAGAWTVFLAGTVGARAIGVRGATVASLVLAVHPLCVGVGAAHRGYAVALLACALALAAVWAAWDSERRDDAWRAGIAVASMAWSHYSLVVAAFALVGVLAVRSASRARTRRIWSVGVTLVWIAPLLPLLAQGAALKRAEFPLYARDFSYGQFVRSVTPRLAGLAVPSILDQTSAPRSLPLEVYAGLAALLLGVLLTSRPRALSVSAALVALVTGLWAFAAASRISTVRDLTFIGIFVPVALACGWLVERVGTKGSRGVRWGIVAVSVAWWAWVALPTLRLMARDVDPNGFATAVRLSRAHPEWPVLVPEHTLEWHFAHTGDRRVRTSPTVLVTTTTLDGRGCAPLHGNDGQWVERTLLVVPKSCALASLGMDPARCVALDAVARVFRCEAHIPASALAASR